MSPKTLDSVLVTMPKLVSISAVSLCGIHRSRAGGQVFANVKKIVPMLLAFVLIVLRHVDKVVQFGMVEGPFVLIGCQIPGVPHLGDHDCLANLVSPSFDELRPILAPLRLAFRFVVDAVQDMVIAKRMFE